MNKARRNKLLIVAFALALASLLPALASAQSTNLININTCSQLSTSPLSSSIGAYGATGGVYVPVADATVELNTGTIVYETCVLRELVDAERIADTAYIANNTTNQILTGRTVTQSNGQSTQTTQGAQFVQQQGAETILVRTNAVTNYEQNGLNSLDPNVKAQVQQAIAQGYAVATYQAPTTLTCPYSGVTSSFTNANAQFTWNSILAVASPCNPLFAYVAANDLVMSNAAQEENCQQNQWIWGSGFYSVTSGSGGPCEQTIVTPSSNVNSLYSQVLQSPYNQLQNANDIGQLISGAFAGIGERVLSGSGGGIPALEQSSGNVSSLSQIAAQLGSQSTSLALNDTLMADIQYVGGQYIPAENQILQSLAQATSSLSQQQASCWQTVIKAVCGTATPAGNTCTPTAQQCTTNIYGGAQVCSQVTSSPVTIATSTNDFAGAAINAANFYGGQSIQTIYASTVTNLANAQQLLSTLNAIYSGINSASPNTAVLSQISTLPSVNTLAQQASTASQNAQAISSLISGTDGTSYITQLTNGWEGQTTQTDSNGNPVINSWSGTLPPNGTDTGWCNATSGTVSAWEKAW